MARKLRLVTIGYEGASLAAFIDTLKEAGVTLLLDVRELPSSRRKGFSKTPLADALASEGITYRHERELGTPKSLRHQYREDGDRERYFAAFREFLKAREKLLGEVAASLQGTVALMCFERKPEECHRSIVATELAKRTRAKCTHLFVAEAGFLS